MAEKQKLKVGDLVIYQPSHQNFYANGSKELGVVLEILEERVPLYINFPDKNYFEHEYKVKWINSGYTSTLQGFNLKKIEISE